MDRMITDIEADQHFSDVLRGVALGDSFTVTSAGKPVARVVPVDDCLERRRKSAAELMEKWAKNPVRVIGPWTRGDLYE